LAATVRQLWKDFSPFLKINNELVKMNKYDWDQLANGQWPAALSRFEKPADKTGLRAVWVWRNYRAVNIEGVRVLGRKFEGEKEFISRGIPASQIKEYQDVSLECRLWIESRSVQGAILRAPKVPLHPPWRHAVYGRWLPFAQSKMPH
jgi:hypothetical protein